MADIPKRRVDHKQTEHGEGGKEIISDSVARTSKNYGILHAITDCVIETMTDVTIQNVSGAATAMDTKTIKAGDRYFGVITAIKLTSGTMAAHNR